MTHLSVIRVLLCCVTFFYVTVEGSIATRAANNLNNACDLFREKIGWRTITSEASEKWGVPVSVILAIMHQESRFKSTAAAKTTTAFGYSQALDETWEEYRAATKTKVADRTTLSDSADFIGWYMTQTTQKIGLPLEDVTAHYLTYHEGHAGYQSKRWKKQPKLITIARKVADRAKMYERQLQQCGFPPSSAVAEQSPKPLIETVAIAEITTAVPRLKPRKVFVAAARIVAASFREGTKPLGRITR